MKNKGFEIISKINLNESFVGDKFPTSDYSTITNDGNFVQFSYYEDKDESKKLNIKPGIFTMCQTMEGMYLEETRFINDKILTNFISIDSVSKRIDQFFNKIHIYKDLGFEIAKRGILLWGPPGTGKSTLVKMVCEKYVQDNKTFILTWRTDKINPSDVADFIKTFNFDNIDKMILVAEDIGGVEIEDARIPSKSSLLALLDNQESIFKKPILILATTNFPEMFLSNLTNRPNRFDDKIEIGFPTKEARIELLEFFMNRKLDENELLEFSNSKYKDFTPAHIREIVIRSMLFDLSILESLVEMCKEIKLFKNNFDTTKNLSIGLYE